MTKKKKEAPQVQGQEVIASITTALCVCFAHLHVSSMNSFARLPCMFRDTQHSGARIDVVLCEHYVRSFARPCSLLLGGY